MHTNFKTERFWLDDRIISLESEHDTLQEAKDYIARVDKNDPDNRLSWNLIEMKFHVIEGVAQDS